MKANQHEQIQMIVSDLDGTLLGNNSKVPPENALALQKAAARGLVIAIASGRLPAVCSRIALEAGLSDCRIIGMNGAQIWEKPFGNPIFEVPYPRLLAKKIVEILQEERCIYNAYTADGVFSNRRVDRQGEEYFREHFANAGVHVIIGECAGRQALDEPIFKFLVKSSELPGGYDRARERISVLPGIWLTASAKDNFEVMQEGVGKADAIRKLAECCGIAMENIMAFGDYDNDLEMLNACGHAVAMGNASPSAKAAAQYITTDHLSGGVGAAVTAFLDGHLDTLKKKT